MASEMLITFGHSCDSVYGGEEELELSAEA